MTKVNFTWRRAIAFPVIGLIGLLTIAACTAPSDKTVEPSGADTSSDIAPHDVVKSPSDKRGYKTVTLENGLEVLLVSDPEAEKSAAALSVGVGSMFNPEDFQGLAHFLEHMLSMGTEQFPEPDEYDAFMSENGGLNNAYTSLLITNYMFEVKSDAYVEGLDRFSDFFKAPLLNPEYTDKEKNAVNAEWLMRKDNDYIAMWTLGRELHGEHPSNTFAVGNLETLGDKADRTTHGTMLKFYEKYYSANVMRAVLLSDRSLDELTALAETHFSGIENKNIEKPEVAAALGMSKATGQLIHFVPKEDTRTLGLEFIIDNNIDQFRSKPNEYLGYIIGSEMPNTPASVLKELGWISSLGASSSPNYFGNYGIFDITIELTEEGMKHRPEITDLVLGYIENIRKQGVDDRYADEFATSLENKFRFLEKTGDFNYVSSLAATMQEYPVKHVIDNAFVFDGFDNEAVSSVLEQLTPERLRVWYVSKEEPGDQTLQYYGGRYSIEPLQVSSSDKQLAMIEQYELAMPALNTLLPESFELKHAGANPEKVLDADGFEIWLQGSEVYPEQPKGFTQIYLNSDARQKSPAAAVMFSLWADLYGLSQAKLFEEARVAGMNPSVASANGIQMSVSGFTDKQPELISEAIAGLNIEFSNAELVQAVDRYTRAIQNRKFQFPFRQVFPIMRGMTQTGNYADDTLLQATQTVDKAALEAFVAGQLASSRVRVYMFGNYSVDDAKALKESLNVALTSRQAPTYVRSKDYSPEAGVKLVYQDDVPGENVAMLQMFTSQADDFKARASANVLAEHFHERTFNQLRTEEQLGYAVFGVSAMLGEYPAIGFIIQTPVKNPEEMYARFDAFKGEYLEAMQSLSQEQFDALKRGVLTNLTETPKNLAEEAGPFIADWAKEEYGFDSKKKLIAAVEAVTLEEAKAFYRDTLAGDDANEIVVQLRGESFAETPFAQPPGAEMVTEFEAFHERMPKQP